METCDQLSDEEMLTPIIQAEAAREPFRGKLAVRAVIARRVQSGRYGDGVLGDQQCHLLCRRPEFQREVQRFKRSAN